MKYWDRMLRANELRSEDCKKYDDMYYYNNARSENNKLAMLNSLKNRNEAFNYYYRRIRLGVLGWEKK